MKTRKFRIVYDPFTGYYTAEIKILNLIWSTWFSTCDGTLRTCSSTSKNDIYNFIEKVKYNCSNLNLIEDTN